MPAMTEKNIHEGRNVKRIREILGIKQDTLAMELGLSQQAVSPLEQKEALDKEMLEKIAAVLKVPAESIRNFNEETTVNFISSTFNHHDNSSVYGHYTFNPVDKVVELYERILKEKDEKIALLEKLMNR
jgi:transcriptional regulator with XRE-family HTH domain